MMELFFLKEKFGYLKDLTEEFSVFIHRCFREPFGVSRWDMQFSLGKGVSEKPDTLPGRSEWF
jgi:hypothetical protein